MNALEEIKKLKDLYEKAKQPAIQTLLNQKKAIDDQLEELGYFAKTSGYRKSAPRKCRACGNTGHTARNCPQVKR